ncbi:hypothetical protein [Thiohalophilus sp.]|uniref:hypothetical protein n=1 Tax=Thiohalophilus sp. TaxID=3028392 RepID=UPI002ACEA624|nr:hypothetical protein [Thiohalophilus sp.]MDZ7661669.1 hypothetical protein [Thiohalophilus sp.]
MSKSQKADKANKPNPPLTSKQKRSAKRDKDSINLTEAGTNSGKHHHQDWN